MAERPERRVALRIETPNGSAEVRAASPTVWPTTSAPEAQTAPLLAAVIVRAAGAFPEDKSLAELAVAVGRFLPDNAPVAVPVL